MKGIRTLLKNRTMRKVVLFFMAIFVILLAGLWTYGFIYYTGQVLPELAGVIILILAGLGIAALFNKIKK